MPMPAADTLALPASVTLDDMLAVLGMLDLALVSAETGTETGPLTVDLSAVQTLDTSAVALLLHTQRLAAAQGRQVVWHGLPDKLLALAQLYGVDSLLSSSATGATRNTPRDGGGGSA